MVLVNAISVVIFPNLRRCLKDNHANFNIIYELSYKLFNICLIIFLLFAYPFEFIITNFLPKYISSISYLYILMPIIIFDSNWAIFGSTVLKLFRKEKYILKIAIISVLISVLLCSGLFFSINNLTAYSYIIILTLGFRYIYTEICIRNIFNINLFRCNLMIIFTVMLYIFVNICFERVLSIIIFSAYVCLVLVVNRNVVYQAIKFLRVRV